jgi:hypothetical protein
LRQELATTNDHLRAAAANQSNSRERRKTLFTSENSELLLTFVAELKREAPNLEASGQRIRVDAIEIAGIAQSSFATFSSLLSSSHDSFHRHSAFYIYHTGAAGSLLRSTCGAIPDRRRILERLAHQRYRDCAEVEGEPKRRRKIEETQRAFQTA